MTHNICSWYNACFHPPNNQPGNRFLLIFYLDTYMIYRCQKTIDVHIWSINATVAGIHNFSDVYCRMHVFLFIYIFILWILSCQYVFPIRILPCYGFLSLFISWISFPYWGIYISWSSFLYESLQIMYSFY
jgi:hypothetical protein